jgi:hypothetical protein
VVISPANPSGYAGSAISYTVSVTSNDTTGCSANTFSLAAGQPSGWTGNLSASTLSLGPGQTGSATMTVTAPAGTAAASYALSATASSGSFAGSGTGSCTVLSAPALAVTVSTSATTYTVKGNNSVPITATVLSGGQPAAGASVTFTLVRADGSSVAQSATSASSGTATWSYKLGQKALTGDYKVSARASSSSGGQASSNTASFTVK